MAQYYQVLRQTDKDTAEELRQFYPNIIENQTVQYVLNPEDQQQQFPTQQILLSSDQVMVIENSSQHVVVDQSAVTYQNSQYVIQDNNGDYQNSSQQIYFMKEVEDNRQIPVEQQIQQTQPLVLNNQLQSPVRNQSLTSSSKVNVQIRPELHPIEQPRTPQTTVRHILQQNERDNEQTLTLEDGRVIDFSEYKKILLETKQKLAAKQGGLEIPSIAKFKAEPAKFRTGKVNRGGRTARKNVSKTNITNNSESFINQDKTTNNMQQRFLSQQQQQQQIKHINQPQSKQCVQSHEQYTHQVLSQTPTRQHQSEQPQYVQPQYIIQPPSQHHQQQHRPLPSFVAPSQIQQIIENTPISEEHSDSIRMLVLLENCEQRLITFTLPKEACTIQEILEQVGVPFSPETKIECTETSNFGINYLVIVGSPHQDNNSNQGPEKQDLLNSKSADTATTSPEIAKPLSPEQPSEIEEPQYIPGLLAVCNHCGYTSENFRRCLRCRFKLPEDVKTRPVLINNGVNGKKIDTPLKSSQNIQDKRSPSKNCNIGSNKLITAPNKKKRIKVIDPEPVVLTLSSDDEDSESSKHFDSDELIRKFSNASVTLSAIKKEPTTSDMKQNLSYENESYTATGGGKDDTIVHSDLETTLLCRTVRIGSYKYVPLEDIIIKSQSLTLKVPTPNDPDDIKVIEIDRKNIVKVLVNFNKALPVLFYYVVEQVGEYIRDELGMVEGSEIYFDPLSKDESFKRITIILNYIPDSTKIIIKSIYTKPYIDMEELTSAEANDILIKTCPKEVTKALSSAGCSDIKQLFIYPPGKGGLSVNTEDYLCLGQDQFLNDVIIDFYLKYVVLHLPEPLQKKVHVFSTFFYKRLTTKPLKASRRSHPAEVDPSLTPAQKRHSRVVKWTKNVNLFEKDFIIIPINENCHWFLAIVCFPGMDGCKTWDGNPITVERKQKKKKLPLLPNITITTLDSDKDQTGTFDDPDASDKDEAEGDESELDSEVDSDEAETPELLTPPESITPPKRQPIKQASILIFDSLAGASRARVVATLRDYLTCEYKVKMGVEKVFNKDVIKGSCPKVPQQTNFTDCGLYLLQYVEQFFKDPIKDYRVPIKEVKEWFDEFVVTKKREDISLLIKELMRSYNKDPSYLPNISFPTIDGKLIQRDEDDEEEFTHDEFCDEEEDEEDMLQDDEDSDLFNESIEQQIEEEMPVAVSSAVTGPIRINLNYNNRKDKTSAKMNAGFVEEPISEAFLKPDMSETVNNSNRDTLSYLKAKRISRHKDVSSSDLKRFKPSD